MPDFAPNYTGRYRIHYTVLGRAHTLTWRVPHTITDGVDAAAKMGAFLDAMADILFSSFTVTAADFAVADTDIFLPSSLPVWDGGGGSEGSAATTDRDLGVSFVGRSTAGNKARFFLFGTTLGLAVRTGTIADWKATATEYPDSIGDAVTVLNDGATELVANDDHPVVWYSYANVKYNDRWVRHDRRG